MMETQLGVQVEERIKSRFHPTSPISSSVACNDPVSRMMVTAKPLMHSLRSTHADTNWQNAVGRGKEREREKNHPDTFSNNGVTVEEALWVPSRLFELRVAFSGWQWQPIRAQRRGESCWLCPELAHMELACVPSSTITPIGNGGRGCHGADLPLPSSAWWAAVIDLLSKNLCR